MVDFHNGISSKNSDHAAITQVLPRQPQNQRIELRPTQFHAPHPDPPVETSLIQTTVGQCPSWIRTFIRVPRRLVNR